MSDRRLRLSYDRLLAIRAEAAPDRGSCPSLDALVGLVLREGPEDTRLALLDHVMGCPFCGAEFAMLRTSERASRAEPQPE